MKTNAASLITGDMKGTHPLLVPFIETSAKRVEGRSIPICKSAEQENSPPPSTGDDVHVTFYVKLYLPESQYRLGQPRLKYAVLPMMHVWSVWRPESLSRLKELLCVLVDRQEEATASLFSLCYPLPV